MKNRLVLVVPSLFLVGCFVYALSLFARPVERETFPESLFDESRVVGYLDGEPVTFGDLRNKTLSDARKSFYEQLKRAFEDYSLDKLKENLPETLSRPSPADDEEVRLLYESNSTLRENYDFGDVKESLRQRIEAQRKVELDRLVNDYAVRNDLAKFALGEPEPYLVKVSTDTAYLRGNPKARLMLMEFSDYQCPFCRRVQPTVNRLIETYGDRFAFGYRHFPLAFHAEADEASIAVECAREQDRFEVMHSLLFAQSFTPDKDNLKKTASRIPGLDFRAFRSCLDDEKYRSRVDDDLAEGSLVGLRGTPSFIIGFFDPENKTLEGEIFSGALDYEDFGRKFESYLER